MLVIIEYMMDFYTNLPEHFVPLRDLLKDEFLFESLPRNWHAVVADIENRKVIEEKSIDKEIPLIIVESITTVLNMLKIIDTTVKVPYFFGTESVTFIIPNELISQVLHALKEYSMQIEKSNDLNLRVGSVILRDIYQNNVSLRIAKLKHNKDIIVPVVIGNGLKVAEVHIKDNFITSSAFQEKQSATTFQETYYRTDDTKYNREESKIMRLRLSCDDESKQAQVYKNIMDEINYIFGTLDDRRTMIPFKLKLHTSIKEIRKGIIFKIGKYDRKYLIRNWLLFVFKKYYFRIKPEEKHYSYQVLQLSDTITLDGAINTVIHGTNQQIRKFQTFLDNSEFRKEITYKLHVGSSSIMPSRINDQKESHVHYFLGSNKGGYTTATTMFKQKLPSKH